MLRSLFVGCDGGECADMEGAGTRVDVDVDIDIDVGSCPYTYARACVPYLFPRRGSPVVGRPVYA